MRPPSRRRLRRRAAAVGARRAGLRRAPADLQPRRLGGRAVGQRRARGDPVPAPQPGGPTRHVLDPDGGGRDPADDHRRDDVHGRHGPGEAALEGLPRRRRRRDRDAGGRRARVALPARVDRQPAVRDPRGRTGSRSWTSPRSAPRSSTTSCFRTAPTSRSSARSRPASIRARIFERGVGETHVLRHGRRGRRGRLRPARRRQPGDGAPRRRRARGRGRRGPAREPDRLGRPGVPGRAGRRAS